MRPLEFSDGWSTRIRLRVVPAIPWAATRCCNSSGPFPGERLPANTNGKRQSFGGHFAAREETCIEGWHLPDHPGIPAGRRTGEVLQPGAGRLGGVAGVNGGLGGDGKGGSGGGESVVRDDCEGSQAGGGGAHGQR